jgi:RNA polymerase sigma-70 factor (family 1)
MIVIKSHVWWVFFRPIAQSIAWISTADTEHLGDNWVLAFKAGDEKAFKLIFEQNFHKLYAFAYKMLKSKEQAEEVVHDAFLSAWNNRDRINASLPITPYIYTITKRLALNTLRQISNSQRAVDELWKQLEERSNLTEEAILFNDLQRLTQIKIALLPPQQQQIFRMSKEEGLSHEEISEKLGVSKNTVRNHLFLALKTLRQHLNESFIFILVGFLNHFVKIYTFFHIPLVHI